MLSWFKKDGLQTSVPEQSDLADQPILVEQVPVASTSEQDSEATEGDGATTALYSPTDGVLLGRILSMKGDFGFIQSDDVPKPVYFKVAWYRGPIPLAEGDEITFSVREVADGKYTAQNISRTKAEVAAEQELEPKPRLLNWAYLGYFPDVWRKLSEMALDEDWEFKNNTDPDRPKPILHSYFMQTYARLVDEKKVLVDDSRSVAAFNTGLVDKLYEPIYALFERQADSRSAWRLGV